MLRGPVLKEFCTKGRERKHIHLVYYVEMDIHTAVRSRICHIWNWSNDNGISEDVNCGPGCVLKERRADSVHGKRFRVGTEPLI